MKVKRTVKMILVIGCVLLLNSLMIWNSVQAVLLNEANIHSEGDCGNLLRYKGVVVKTYYASYKQDEISYPAYCLDKAKQGVSNDISYPVSVEDAISDVGLWRYIVQGYPYKTIEELGCINKEEAFTATKQAIYCYIHENQIEDYSGIGEAGTRTLEALKKIVFTAQNSAENQISNTIQIQKMGEGFLPDEKEIGYLSREYEVVSKGAISDYRVNLLSLEESLRESILVRDKNGKEKEVFKAGESFKILIPIKDITKAGSFEIQVDTKIKTKPVFYGRAGNTYYQDYALTASTYEDSIESQKDSYPNNDTEIKIIKEDKETSEKLSGVQFVLLDEKKEVVYENLATDENGEIFITSILPGIYYLKEIKTKEGYVESSQELEIVIGWNEKIVVTVYNQKEEIPDIEIEEPRRLPVTGM